MKIWSYSVDQKLSRVRYTSGASKLSAINMDGTDFTFSMRIWAYFRSNGISHPMLNHEEPQFGSWEAFIPYTNVLWLYYILHYIQENYCGASAFLDVFKSETEELRRKIHPDTSVFNGGFDSANEIFIYTIKKGWLKKTDLEPSATPSL